MPVNIIYNHKKIECVPNAHGRVTPNNIEADDVKIKSQVGLFSIRQKAGL